MPRASLHIGSSTAAAWQNILTPWFRNAAGASWKGVKPVLVIVPSPSNAYALKARLLEDEVSFLGIQFVTPPRLRELLAQPDHEQLPLREHLRLLLAIAAEEGMKLPADPIQREKRMLEPDFLAAKSVKRTPDHLLRTIDQLGAAGWNFSSIQLPA